MNVKAIGHGYYRLTEVIPANEDSGRPDEIRSILFTKTHDDIMIIRGNYMISKAEVMRAAAVQ